MTHYLTTMQQLWEYEKAIAPHWPLVTSLQVFLAATLVMRAAVAVLT